MKTLSLLALSSVTLGLATAAHASFLIDDFSSSDQNVYARGPGDSFYVRATGSMFGGSRTLSVSNYPDAAFSGYTSANVSRGAFTGGSDFGTSGNAVSWYGAVGLTSDRKGVIYDTDTNLDMSEASGYKIDFLGLDKPLVLQVRLFSAVDNGGFQLYTRTYQKTIAANESPFSVLLGANDILGDNPLFDIKKVDLFYLGVFNQPSGDFGITSFQAVPEPASMIALGAGAFALLRKRRQAR